MREMTLFVDMHLVFGTADRWYSRKTARKWMATVLAAFEANMRLDGSVKHAYIAAIHFGDLDLEEFYPNQEYTGITFTLAPLFIEGVTIAP
jgi:hypothetical protein